MKIDQLTFTRFIAAIGIVIFHFGKGTYPFNTGFLFVLLNNFNVAVSYFFCLSGFVMIVAYHHGDKRIDIKNYYINRFAKIYPIYLLALCGMLFFVSPIIFQRLLSEIFLVQSMIPGHLLSYNLPDWSLSVEMFFYLLFPFLYNRFYLKNSLTKLCFAIIAIWLLSQIACYFLSIHLSTLSDLSRNFIFYSPVIHLNEFLTGNLLGFIYLKFLHKRYFKTDYAMIIFFALAGVTCLLLPLIKSYGLKLPVNLHNGLLVIIFAPFILFLSLNKGYIASFFSKPVFIYLGEISYCIYILQYPVYIWCCHLFHVSNPSIFLGLSILILIAIAALVYSFIELPAKQIVRKYLKKINN
ncbi:acyltransferase [Mucilaginibacter sp. UR6-11]|uniref:acyltransferase family protein n=1 Tax=Mucilaginibacter sp. UR6-11 TaxID=1435644 RepID=UPI001E503362|nr:acyltransferase [Mucilaginibacter sp. UR6-11]MCC8425423.1 acyltransferase [Mucilaginibacter sp. UR6-11]